jgi:nicotinate-nucleotide pyrophosphorylase (carboxylating)
MVDPSLSCHCSATDGEELKCGTVLARLEGSAHALLSLERTALNLLQHASGIADLTARFVKAVAGYPCDILDTRKTLPNLRALQKYAVTVGGGKNHRFDLHEQFLIKNNHLKLLSATTPHPVREAVRRAKMAHPEHEVEIEVETLEMLESALEAGAERILLDNMPPPLVADAVKITAGRVYLEASGGIALANAASYAATGVNGISIGALTHSAQAVDISLGMEFVNGLKESADFIHPHLALVGPYKILFEQTT